MTLAIKTAGEGSRTTSHLNFKRTMADVDANRAKDRIEMMRRIKRKIREAS